jgi:arsenical pump membrane protein
VHVLLAAGGSTDLLALSVSAVVLVATLIAALTDHPRVSPVAVALPGAAYLVLVGAVGEPEAEGAVRDIAPTVAFLVVVLLLSHLADREGLFTWAAAVTARRSGRSARALLLRVVVLSAVVTAVLSLDATVVLLTPVVVATAARMRTAALPHAYAAGHLANTASLLLPVSNLTNLLAFAATGLSFLHFTGLMLAPWLVAVAVEFAVLRWLFRAELAKPAGEPVTSVPPLPAVAVVVVGLVVVGFGVASLVGVSPIWPAVLGVVVLAGRQLIRRTTRVADLVQAADLPFALFVLALAVVVLAVLTNGVETFLLTVLPDGESLGALLTIAGVAALLANLLNNLPATLALLPVLAVGGAGPVLAMLIGVNVGPNLTYVGSLANLLWRRVLGREAPSSAQHTAVGLATVPLTLVTATVALWAALQI